MTQPRNNQPEKPNRYTAPVMMLIISLLLGGAAAAAISNSVLSLIVGVAALALVIGASVIGVREMQNDPRLKE